MPPTSGLPNEASSSGHNLLMNSQVSIIEDQEQPLQPPPESAPLDLRLPLSGAKVLKHYLRRPGLTEYEKSEILDYKVCHYLGLGSEKIKGSRQQQYNYGFDDERGDYNVVL